MGLSFSQMESLSILIVVSTAAISSTTFLRFVSRFLNIQLHYTHRIVNRTRRSLSERQVMNNLVASSVSATLFEIAWVTRSACSLRSWLVLDSVLPIMPRSLILASRS